MKARDKRGEGHFRYADIYREAAHTDWKSGSWVSKRIWNIKMEKVYEDSSNEINLSWKGWTCVYKQVLR